MLYQIEMVNNQCVFFTIDLELLEYLNTNEGAKKLVLIDIFKLAFPTYILQNNLPHARFWNIHRRLKNVKQLGRNFQMTGMNLNQFESEFSKFASNFLFPTNDFHCVYSYY